MITLLKTVEATRLLGSLSTPLTLTLAMVNEYIVILYIYYLLLVKSNI
jgi:hypothetical protein